jgi:hypothetical protein
MENRAFPPFLRTRQGKPAHNGSMGYKRMENFFGLKIDDRNVYSRSGTPYRRTRPRDRNHVHEPRLPYIKRARAKGHIYHYFVGPAKTLLNRLPNPNDPSFGNAYLNELAKLEGDEERRYRAVVKQFVYFVGGDVGGIKIGTAREPSRRLADLQCGSPVRLAILAVVSGTHELELEYHRRFAAHRLHGEWFERHPDILAEIERLAHLTKGD